MCNVEIVLFLLLIKVQASGFERNGKPKSECKETRQRESVNEKRSGKDIVQKAAYNACTMWIVLKQDKCIVDWMDIANDLKVSGTLMRVIYNCWQKIIKICMKIFNEKFFYMQVKNNRRKDFRSETAGKETSGTNEKEKRRSDGIFIKTCTCQLWNVDNGAACKKIQVMSILAYFNSCYIVHPTASNNTTRQKTACIVLLPDCSCGQDTIEWVEMGWTFGD